MADPIPDLRDYDPTPTPSRDAFNLDNAEERIQWATDKFNGVSVDGLQYHGGSEDTI